MTFADSLVNNPILAANRLMTIFYRDCNRTKLAPYDFLKSGEIKGFTTQFNPRTNGRVSISIDSKKNLSSYLWGGKGKILSGPPVLVDIFHNEDNVEDLAHHPGLDCSGFINLTFLYAGLKVDPKISFLSQAQEVSAKEFMRPLGCFKEIELENGEKIQKGDVISWNKHIVMIDSINRDPFGINAINNPEDCNLLKLNPTKAKMIVINSKGSNDPQSALNLEMVQLNSHLKTIEELATLGLTGTGPGLIKLNFYQLALSYPIEVMEMIQTACLAKFQIHLPPKNWKIVRHILSMKNYSKEDLKNCSINKIDRPQFLGDELNCSN